MTKKVSNTNTQVADRFKDVWVPVKGYEGYYEVSDQGKVRRLDITITNINGVVRRLKGRVLRLGKRGDYLGVNLSKHNKIEYKYVHVLVIENHVMPRPKGMEIDHVNQDKHDNRVRNLTYCSTRENQANRRVPNKHGYTGVSKNEAVKDKKYFAQIRIGEKRLNLGYYRTAKEASRAYESVKRSIEFQESLKNN